MKKRLVLILFSVTIVFLLLPNMHFSAFAEGNGAFEVNAKSAVLMDSESGEVLYAKNADEALPPASVTKIMTLLLVMEAVDSDIISLDDMVTVSENAASMGGSQVYLEPGEEMTVEEMLKCVVVSSANDAAVALAEKIGGSEASFVQLMNEKAKELGMNNTNFENTTGLDDNTVNHNISAYDIALMSKELITKHPKILDYTTIWMDTIRGGTFGLSNTNRLIRFYNGATGLKTGSTSKAGFCISATAKRDDMHLIAVIMGAETRDVRNSAAASLLDWGFANYSQYMAECGVTDEVKVTGGVKSCVKGEYEAFSKLMTRGMDKNTKQIIELYDNVSAPVKKGDVIGKVKYICNGETVGEVPVLAAETVERINFWGIIIMFFRNYCLM